MTCNEKKLISYCLSLRDDRAFRDKEERCLIEGKNLIFDLLKTHRAKRLFVGPGESLDYDNVDEVIPVSRITIEKIASTKNPDNLIAEFVKPDYTTFKKERFIVALQNLQDPGNVGTILRSAFALGWEGAFFIEPSCDPFNDKALRAAKGATFDLPLARGSLDDLMALSKKLNLPLYAADLSGVTPESISKKEGMILLFGSEAKGVTKEFQGKRVTIPMKNKIDSLNVSQAASILLYLLQP